MAGRARNKVIEDRLANGIGWVGLASFLETFTQMCLSLREELGHELKAAAGFVACLNQVHCYGVGSRQTGTISCDEDSTLGMPCSEAVAPQYGQDIKRGFA